jgi:hypothetical protein
MANSDKNIVITPNTGSASLPQILVRGSNNTPLFIRILDDGTVSFEGTAGQLFSVSDGMSGTIFAVSDISGIPSIEVLDTGTVRVAQYGGNVGVGIATPTSKLHVNGAITAVGNVIPSATNLYDLGSTSLRWRNIFTQDLHLSNGIGDYTIIEGEEDLFLVNNKTGKSFKFMLKEVDNSEVPPKSES